MAFIIEGEKLEHNERLELESAGRSILLAGQLKALSADEQFVFALFEDREGSKALAYVPKTNLGDYLLEESLCSKCHSRPLLPCVHAYAAALAAKRLS